MVSNGWPALYNILSVKKARWRGKYFCKLKWINISCKAVSSWNIKQKNARRSIKNRNTNISFGEHFAVVSFNDFHPRNVFLIFHLRTRKHIIRFKSEIRLISKHKELIKCRGCFYLHIQTQLTLLGYSYMYLFFIFIEYLLLLG